MMKSVGIIGEYNPFHQGHAYLISETRRMTDAEVVVSVMSGDFTQRGEPAVRDKWERAESAVKNGINLVIELPTVFACNSAEFFAGGAVRILEEMGGIDCLAFGSECGDIEQLTGAAAFLAEHDAEIQKAAADLLKHGYSYPRAREAAVLQLAPWFDVSLIREPNNILALEYLGSLQTMRPVTVKRRGEQYHASATSLREELYREDPHFFDQMEQRYFSHVSARILQSDREELERIFSSGEGLGNKLKKEIRYADSVTDLIERVKSKAYTRTRIARLLTQVLLGIDEACVRNARPYVRLLAMDAAGGRFIREIKKAGCCRLPIITNINREKDACEEVRETLAIDILASDMYNLISGQSLYEYSDYVKSPYIGI
ncbi:MAG: nucleotidyltransferase family protein [Eubacterium sp.]|nr:nucleotidyltransferase family protein [Eubacterium sp.]